MKENDFFLPPKKKNGDVVLFKASNGMQFYKIADEYQKYVEKN